MAIATLKPRYQQMLKGSALLAVLGIGYALPRDGKPLVVINHTTVEQKVVKTRTLVKTRTVVQQAPGSITTTKIGDDTTLIEDNDYGCVWTKKPGGDLRLIRARTTACKKGGLYD